MKILLSLALIAIAGFFWFDDNSNRNNLENANKQIKQLTQERDQAIQKLRRHINPTAQTTSAQPPDWIQEHMKEKSSLDTSHTNLQSKAHK